MSSIAIIPARGGSKRIPRKNIRDFCGAPLISYSITAARNSGVFDRVVVSTDDDEIATVARGYGADVPFMRDKKLSDDYTGTNAVVADALKRLERGGQSYKTVACVYATAPLLTPEWIRKAYDAFTKSKVDIQYCCCEFPFPIQRARYLDDKGYATWVFPEYAAARSQDLRKTYQDAGMLYFFNPQFLRGELQEGGVVVSGFVMPRYRVIDIDTPEDFSCAQAMMRAVRELQLD